MKTCNKCHQEKTLEEFIRSSKSKDGRRGTCSVCRRNYDQSIKETREGQKYCRGCQQWKPIDEFHAKSDQKDGLQTRCKPCAIAEAKAWREGNTGYYWVRKERDPNYFRNRKFISMYGITFDHYTKLSEAQGHVCAICKEPETRRSHGKLNHLVVDHNHETGEVRGLLCHRCNTSLAPLERKDWLPKAMEYLKNHAS